MSSVPEDIRDKTRNETRSLLHRVFRKASTRTSKEPEKLSTSHNSLEGPPPSKRKRVKLPVFVVRHLSRGVPDPNPDPRLSPVTSFYAVLRCGQEQ